MRKLENQLVAAITSGDLPQAEELLAVLAMLDRRRVWWALVRAAGQIEPDSRARVALVTRTYIARRSGRMIGATDEQIARTLIVWITAREIEAAGRALTIDEAALLIEWLPRRLQPLIPWGH